jgi:hypothetical protein
VLVAQHLLKLGAHLTTALAHLQVHELARRSSLEVGSTREKKGRGKWWKNVRNSVWRFVFGTGTRNVSGARACFPNGKVKLSSNLFELLVGTVQSTLGEGGCGRETFASATCSLQLAKASAATLSQQEENESADVQRGRVNISGFLGAKVS